MQTHSLTAFVSYLIRASYEIEKTLPKVKNTFGSIDLELSNSVIDYLGTAMGVYRAISLMCEIKDIQFDTTSDHVILITSDETDNDIGSILQKAVDLIDELKT